jgi:hypothetical protein
LIYLCGVNGSTTVSKTASQGSNPCTGAILGLVAEWLRSGLQNRAQGFDSLPDLQIALLAQLDRACDYESGGREFDSLKVRQIASLV